MSWPEQNLFLFLPPREIKQISQFLQSVYQPLVSKVKRSKIRYGTFNAFVKITKALNVKITKALNVPRDTVGNRVDKYNLKEWQLSYLVMEDEAINSCQIPEEACAQRPLSYYRRPGARLGDSSHWRFSLHSKTHTKGLHVWSPRCTPLLTQKHKESQLQWAQTHINDQQTFWNFVLWSTETKLERFEPMNQRYVWRRKNGGYTEKNTLPTVKHGGSVMLWVCFFSSGTANLQRVEDKIYAIKCWEIFIEKTSYHLWGNWNLGVTGSPSRRMIPSILEKSTKTWFQKNSVCCHTAFTVTWLDPIKNLLWNLKKLVAARKPKNTSEPEATAYEERAKIPRQHH